MRDDRNDVIPLGHIAAGDRLSSALEAARRDPDRAVALLGQHRVVGLAAARLAGMESGSALANAFEPAVQRRRTRSRLLVQAWEQVGEAVTQLGICAAGIKGHSVTQLYENPEHRDLGDVDLMVNTVDDAWLLANRLRGHGYDWCEYELPWIKRDSQSGNIYGQAAVWKFHDDIPARIDIHFGGYSIRHCRLFPYQVTSEGLSRTGPLENLPMLLGNASGDFFIRLKDVNDVVCMLRAFSRDQWATALAEVSQLGLDRFWNALLDVVERTAVLTGEEHAAVAALHAKGVTRERVPVGFSSWRARLRATVLDAYRAGLAQQGARTGLAYAWSAYRYYRRPLPITVSTRCRHRRADATLLDGLRNDLCVRLVPTTLIRQKADINLRSRQDITSSAIEGTGVLRSCTSDDHLFVLAGEDVFAPTVYGDICVVQGSH